MFTLKGKYGGAVVMIDDVEPECIAHIIKMLNHPSFSNPVAIMPDTHEGKGSVVGFTMPMTDTLIPNVIGVDISCGMLSCKLTDTVFDGKWFNSDPTMGKDWVDKYIRMDIPFGKEVYEQPWWYKMDKHFPWADAIELNRQFVMALERKTGEKMPHTNYDYAWFKNKCAQIKMDVKRAELSIGTLGGGNHFIEVSQSLMDKSIWVTVHTGSRQFGKCICEYWQDEPARRDRAEAQEKFKVGVDTIRKTKKGSDIQTSITLLKQQLKLDTPKSSDDMAALSGDDKYGYLTDMIFTSIYAKENRRLIMERIVEGIFDRKAAETIETVHNYIDFNDFIIRKGSIAAYTGKKCIIPFNMEDGILVCEGKSNPEWNYSAPHGAGRIMSRSQAKKKFSSEAVAERMKNKGIFTTAVPADEVKEAYKDPKIIEEAIKPTVSIIDRLIPIISLKDGEGNEND